MLPQLLTYEECEKALNWPGAIDALRQCHKLARPQQGDLLLGSGDAKLLNRAARIEGLGFVIKGESVFPGNAQKGMPSVQGVVLLYDPDCGSIRAVIESRIVTQYKTAGGLRSGCSMPGTAGQQSSGHYWSRNGGFDIGAGL